MDLTSQITVIDLDCRYEFEADNWTVTVTGYLEVLKGRDLVVTFAPG
jgi:hypothetical protein